MVALFPLTSELAGMRDKNGVMCLIDPQSHSCIDIFFASSFLMFHCRSEEDSTKRIYWDCGPKAIKHFITHHLKTCHDNAICNALALTTTEFDDSDNDKLKESHMRKASRSPLKLRSSRRAPSGAVRVGMSQFSSIQL